MNEKVIKVADGYKYLGFWLEPTLNMNEHLRKVLRKANARVKLLSRVRDSLSVLLLRRYTILSFYQQCFTVQRQLSKFLIQC